MSQVELTEATETIREYHHTCQADLATSVQTAGLGQCHIYRNARTVPRQLPYKRRTFYKLYLHMAGSGYIHYGGCSLRFDRPALVFTNPQVPYAVHHDKRPQESIFGSFDEAFWQGSGWANSPVLTESPLFRLDTSPVLPLETKQVAALRPLFEQLVTQATGDYTYRCEVLHNYVQLILHEAQRIEPQSLPALPNNAMGRVATLFLGLLNRQFPRVTVAQPLPLRTPQDYADALAVHVNYLSRAVHTATGKTTSQHLAERLVHEATTLLQHSYWSIGDIADALGFAYPTYFNKFFKKHTGCTPLQVRHAASRTAQVGQAQLA
jgi:AraC family transcriptional activator of pobA